VSSAEKGRKNSVRQELKGFSREIAAPKGEKEDSGLLLLGAVRPSSLFGEKKSVASAEKRKRGFAGRSERAARKGKLLSEKDPVCAGKKGMAIPEKGGGGCPDRDGKKKKRLKILEREEKRQKGELARCDEGKGKRARKL